MRLCLPLFRRFLCVLSTIVTAGLISSGALAQSKGLPDNPREQKALQQAREFEGKHQYSFAIDSYNKANKLADGKCAECLRHLCDLYRKVNDNKRSVKAAGQLEQIVTSPEDKATAAVLQGAALLREGTEHKKQALFQQADAEFKQALVYQPDWAPAIFLDGMAAGKAGDDGAAKDAFARYISSAHADPILQARARRYLAEPQLVREKMAPAFSVCTLQGNTVSLDGLQGKVVLLDFWATWCGPCNAELPHIQKIAQRFQGEPLVVLSISIDKDQAKWQAFVAQHGMTWPQYWDQSGSMAQTFGVRAIPNYFTIDTDGVLRSENMGSGADIDWRLKKLVAQAQKAQEQATSHLSGQ
ncbi:MAG: TlpA disulfide reductase family protein [Acidobacteriaceae bacterium]